MCFSVLKAFDRDSDGQVSMLEWVVGLNTYLRGTLDEKITCKSLIRCWISWIGRLFFFFLVAFNCYSLKGEKHITREDILTLLRSSVLKVSTKIGEVQLSNCIDIKHCSFCSKLVTKIPMNPSKNWLKSPWKKWTKIMIIVWVTTIFRPRSEKILCFSRVLVKFLPVLE